jgi:hypothetical protein
MIQHLIMHEKMNWWKISSMKKLITLIRTCMCWTMFGSLMMASLNDSSFDALWFKHNLVIITWFRHSISMDVWFYNSSCLKWIIFLFEIGNHFWIMRMIVHGIWWCCSLNIENTNWILKKHIQLNYFVYFFQSWMENTAYHKIVKHVIWLV